MYYLIQDGKVVGTSDREVGLPQGMLLVESGLSQDKANVYFDGQEVQLKPPKPSPRAFWSEDNEWVEPPEKKVPPQSPQLTTSETANAVKAHIASIDPILAETITWIVGKLTGNRELTEQQEQVLRSLVKKS